MFLERVFAGVMVLSGAWLLAGAELSEKKADPAGVAEASEEAALSMKQFELPEGFKVELFAAEPMVAHPVAFGIDEKNRVFVAESFRVGEQVTDIRRHMNWLESELANRSTAQWREEMKRHLADRLDFMEAETERIRLVEDLDGDGRADRATVFAEGFNDLQSGIAAGVLARRGDVWFTCIPDLWHLRDEDGDGKADQREVLAHGFAVRFGFYGHDLHGLRMGPDGRIYFSIGDRGFHVKTREGKEVTGPEMGAVFRCEPDGSRLEMFASGLRNPQELAFDHFGNLFTGDNNSDGGDQARWVYLVEGGDSGWRIGWQFLNWPVSRGPWNAERMWAPQNERQPAYIVPPLANIGNGPSGLTYNPGTGLPERYDNQFFMADFRGTPATSLVHTFGLRPQGASFEVVGLEPFVSRILVTDVEFGMDGAVYLSDWVEGWGKTGKGRLYRVYDVEQSKKDVVEQTGQIMGSDWDAKAASDLRELLNWPDQRVRQEAQFELVLRGQEGAAVLGEVARAGGDELARLHAVWGLGQLARKGDEGVDLERLMAPVLEVLREDGLETEVRAKAAEVLGEAGWGPALGTLMELAKDTKEPRLQFHAAMALGDLGAVEGAEAILEMARRNGDQDAYLRHAAVMAVLKLGNEAVLREAAADESAAVRMVALLAMRRMEDAAVSQFLADTEPRLVLEAARAIYDLPIEGALPELAALLDGWIESEPLLRRVINANFRVGTRVAAERLARFAGEAFQPGLGRVEALRALEDWGEPPGIDRVTGLWRPMGQREGSVAEAALAGMMGRLLDTSEGEVLTVGARVAGRHEFREATPALVALAVAEGKPSEARVEGLKALARWESPALGAVLEQVQKSDDEEVRKEARRLLAQVDPAAGLRQLREVLEEGTVGEKQAALAVLGSMPGEDAERMLGAELAKLARGELAPELQLDVLDAARRREAAAFEELLAVVESKRPAGAVGEFVECLEGGDAAVGRRIFFERVEASCARCHQIGGEGGEAGPALDRAGLSRNREYLLESIVAPAAKITPGFENVLVTLKSGISYAGILKSETGETLVLASPEDGIVTIEKKEIESRRQGGSGMPAGLGDLLSKRDLRDLVEYLAKVGE